MRAAHRTIVVMRHAKAEQVGPTDFERALARQGLGDAAAAGAWLAGSEVLGAGGGGGSGSGVGEPDRALVSAALRTRQTWAAVAEGASWSLEPTLDESLYSAGPETALDLLRALDDDDVRSVVVVGHNPTMAYLASMLDDGSGDVEAGNALAAGFPTCALAVLTFDTPWSDLAPSSAHLAAFHVARA